MNTAIALSLICCILAAIVWANRRIDHPRVDRIERTRVWRYV